MTPSWGSTTPRWQDTGEWTQVACLQAPLTPPSPGSRLLLPVCTRASLWGACCRTALPAPNPASWGQGCLSPGTGRPGTPELQGAAWGRVLSETPPSPRPRPGPALQGAHLRPPAPPPPRSPLGSTWSPSASAGPPACSRSPGTEAGLWLRLPKAPHPVRLDGAPPQPGLGAAEGRAEKAGALVPPPSPAVQPMGTWDPGAWA